MCGLEKKSLEKDGNWRGIEVEPLRLRFGVLLSRGGRDLFDWQVIAKHLGGDWCVPLVGFVKKHQRYGRIVMCCHWLGAPEQK